jgi:hypothetical protein
MTTADLAYMKGEASVQFGDTVANALERAAQSGYVVPGAQREAFMSGFISNLSQDQAPATAAP